MDESNSRIIKSYNTNNKYNNMYLPKKSLIQGAI